MFTLILSPVYLLVNVYLIFRGLRWLKAVHGVFAKKPAAVLFSLAVSALAVLPVLAFFLPAGGLRRTLLALGNNWMGILLWLFLFLALADLGRLLFRRLGLLKDPLYRSRRALALLGAGVLLCASALSGFCFFTAQNVRTTRYDVSIQKESRIPELTIALISDTHFGSTTGVKRMEQIVERVNAMDADLVCFAGDIFDNEYALLDDPERLLQLFRSLKSRYGVFACWGNHDIEEPILAGFTFPSEEPLENGREMADFLKRAGVTLLEDKAVLVEDSFYVLGRRDSRKPGTPDGERLDAGALTAGLDRAKPLLVLDHEPQEPGVLAKAGADLILSGHTHGGQIFPGNLLMALLWDNPYGLREWDGSCEIVTSGAGTFGPAMRLGTRAEVVEIHAAFSAGN